jgi:hypothetical protein
MGILTLVGACLTLVAVVLLPLVGVETWRLAREGATAPGKVTSRIESTVDDGENSGTRLRVFYRFGPHGDDFEGETSVGRSAYDRLGEGSPIEVRYVADEPRISRIVGASSPDWTWPVVLLGIAGVGMVVVGSVGSARRRRTARRLVDEGVVLEGRVVSTSSLGEDGGPQTLARVKYTFENPGGRALTTEEWVLSSGARNRAAPSEGAGVRVLYLDDAVHALL